LELICTGVRVSTIYFQRALWKTHECKLFQIEREIIWLPTEDN